MSYELRGLCMNDVIMHQNKAFKVGMSLWISHSKQKKHVAFPLFFFSHLGTLISLLLSPSRSLTSAYSAWAINSPLPLYVMWELHKGIKVIITPTVDVVQRGCPGGCKLLQSPLGQLSPVMLAVDETFGAAGSQERAMRQGRSNLQSIFSANHLIWPVTSTIMRSTTVLDIIDFGWSLCGHLYESVCMLGRGGSKTLVRKCERMCDSVCVKRFAIVKLIKFLYVFIIAHLWSCKEAWTLYSFAEIKHYCSRIKSNMLIGSLNIQGWQGDSNQMIYL